MVSTFFTVLIITYTFNSEELQSRILYTSMGECGTAMEKIHSLLDPALKVEMIQCDESDILSRSQRPKARPNH